MMLTDAVFAQNAWEHVQLFFGGAGAISIIGHAVQSFPTPENKYGQWILGSIQYAVGQRYRANNTVQGEGTLTKQVDRETQNPRPKIDAPQIPRKDGGEPSA